MARTVPAASVSTCRHSAVVGISPVQVNRGVGLLPNGAGGETTGASGPVVSSRYGALAVEMALPAASLVVTVRVQVSSARFVPLQPCTANDGPRFAVQEGSI